MKKLLLIFAVFAMLNNVVASAEVITIQGVDYKTDVLIDRDLGPGINYKRLRIPDFPLNVNMIIMDLTNPYNRVETTQGGEQLGKTEKLADAYTRQYTEEKRPLAGANGNFWCVSSQLPWADFITGATFNGNVRNGAIITETNAHTDWWGHNNGCPGCVAITPDKNMVIDFMYYKGSVTNDKFGSLVIQQTNKLVRDNEVGLYNHFFGRTKSFIPVDQYTEESTGNQHLRRVENVSTEVYLTIKEGNTWMVGRPMVCTVAEVKTDAGAGKLGDYDLCLVGRGTNKDALAQLVAGDEVTIDLHWELPDGSAPEIEQLIGGNGVVMVDGVLTDLNQIDGYNTQTYSRCAYGTTADRKTLVNVVIDMSTDPTYGRSAGCNTLVMCDIMKYYGCTNIMNMDAGGSAQMMVNGKVINTTTEGSPRAVANGWFFYSIAPQDNEIARLEFDDAKLSAPVYSSYSPKVLGYNQYGDLVNDNVQGFTLSCDASIGTCDGMTFTAGGTATTGQLTATYNGISVTETMEIVGAEISIRIKPTILIDATREYPIEVTATVGTNVYSYNPATIEWSVEDETIASIDANGVLRGLAEGTTKITGRIGDFVDETNVTVEIADGPKMYPADYTNWAIANGSGVSNTSMSSDGVMTLTYKSARGGGSVTMNSGVVYYSLPDKLWFDFTSTVPLTKIIFSMRANGQALKEYTVLPESGNTFTAGESHKIELPISVVGDAADLGIYPISLTSILCYIPQGSSNSGTHTFTINELSGEYNNYLTGVESVKINEGEKQVIVYPNPVTDGTFAVKSTTEIENVEIYNTAGMKVLSVFGGNNIERVNVSMLANGIYFVKTTTTQGSIVSKIVIK